MTNPITDEQRTALTDAVGHGLVSGLGNPSPGEMCIEAAICLAMGEPHGDKPTCVAAPDRAYAIAINDVTWSSPEARAKALLPLGLASLGTAGTDRKEWVNALTLGTIQRVLPMAFNAAADAHPAKAHQDALRLAADRCATAQDMTAARAAAEAAAEAAGDAARGAWAAADAALRESVQVAIDAYAQTKGHS